MNRLGMNCALLAAVLAAPVLAQVPQPTSSQVGISLSDQPDLARLVDVTAARLGLIVTYDAAALKSVKAAIRQPEPLTDAQLWQLTSRVLAEQGFATIRGPGGAGFSVVKVQLAASLAPLEVFESPGAAAGQRFGAAGDSIMPGFRRVAVRLKHLGTKDAVAAAQVALSKPNGTAAEFDVDDSIVVADFAPYIASALELLSRLDEAGHAAPSVREVAARNVEASKLITLTKQLAEKQKIAGGRELRGDVIAAASGTGLLVVAPPSSIEAWEVLIGIADQREGVERRTYAATAFAAKDVASLIEQTVRGGGGTTSGSATGSNDDRWKLVIDDLTGSLIVTATASQHAQIDELLERLSNVPPEARRNVRSFKIRHRAVRDVQKVLEDLLQLGVLSASSLTDQFGTGPQHGGGPAGAEAASLSSTGAEPQRSQVGAGDRGSGSQQTSGLGTTAGVTSPSAGQPGDASAARTRPPGDSASTRAASRFGIARGGGSSGGAGGGGVAPLTLTSDEATSTIIAVGEPRLLAEVERLIPTLDIRQPQVMLEAILVSLSDSQSLNFGVELERLQLSGDTLIRLSSLFGLSSSGGTGPDATRTVGDSAGFTGAVLNPGDYSIVVRALENLNNGRSLSQPKVLVNNNEQATFNAVLQQPFASTFTPVSSGATTSFGGTQDAGTTISVKPQIAEGDHLVLTYSVSLSSFVGAAASANLPPPRQQNSVQSVATIPDGFTVVVGGLELATNGDGVTQVPLIGNIPILGELFKNRSKSVSHQRFYVFLRANVLRHGGLEDLKYMSELDAGRASIDDGVPLLKPRVIR